VLPVLKRRPEFEKELRQISEERRIVSGLRDEAKPSRTLKERLVRLSNRIVWSLKPW